MRVDEIAGDAGVCAHLLRYGSVHGTWPVDCGAADGIPVIDDRPVTCAADPRIDDGWRDCDIVIEAAGRHHRAPLLVAGACGLSVGLPEAAAPLAADDGRPSALRDQRTSKTGFAAVFRVA